MTPEPLSDWRTLAADWFLLEEPVLAIIRKSYLGTSRELLHDSFIDALLQVCKSDRYDPEQGGLTAFLAACTRRCLRDKVRSDTSRRQREDKKGQKDVADKESAAREVLDLLADAELAEIARKEAQTPEEQRYLELWARGVNDLAQLAQALGVEHLPEAQQKKQVKNTHDRIMKRLQRMMDRLSGEGPGP